MQIREGFIVDEDDEEDQGEGSDVEGRPHGKRKRKHHEHRDKQEEEALDEDDLDLIGEQFGSRPKPQTQVRCVTSASPDLYSQLCSQSTSA